MLLQRKFLTAADELLMNNSTFLDEISWNQYIKSNLLSSFEREYLASWTNLSDISVDDIWSEMDRVWGSFALDNSLPMGNQNISAFYAHPVWMLNGAFTALDPTSKRHRQAIAQNILELGAGKIADFGGGFGELARHITKTSPNVTVDIVEPYPSKLSQYLVNCKKQIRIVSGLDGQYDCLVAQDVLEHVEDPIKLVAELVQATIDGGHLIFANCFKPVINCHLPGTFHLRHTFRWVVESLGLNYCGNVKNAQHALIFQRKDDAYDLQLCRKREWLSKKIDPWFNSTCTFMRKMKNCVIKKET